MSYNYRSVSNNPEERQRVIYPYCFWENAFTNEEIDKICKQMAEIPLTDGKISSIDDKIESSNHSPIPAVDDNVRRSKVSFHTPNESTQWIFERLNSVIELINNRWYNFDINGYDQFQYSEYHSTNNGCYGWHSDLFLGLLPTNSYVETRKLSLTLLLTDPDTDFEGGELQFGHETKFESAKIKKGTLIVFPSFALHQVTPVTKGVRKSIVAWVLGPKWK
jgi:PKHD-type hydroxylase